MNRKVTILVLSIVMLTTISALAQERPNPKEALRWFPDGAYSRFGIYEAVSLRNAEAYNAFKQMFSMSGDSVFGVEVPLPEEFIEKSDYFCFARIVSPEESEMQQALQSQIENEVRNKKDGEIDKKRVERLSERLRDNYHSSYLWAFNIPELDLLVESEVKSGAFARSGKKILGRPLYSLRAKSGRGDNATGSDVYAWASAAGELLLADKPELILSMVAAGEGGGVRMIDNQEYSEFLGYVDEFGNIWSVEARRAEKMYTLERLRDSAADEAKIEELENNIAQNEIFDCQNFFVTDVIVVSSSKVFFDEEIAKKKYAEQTGSFEQAAAQLKQEGKNAIPEEAEQKMSQREKRIVKKALGFAGNLMESMKTTIDGTVVTTTITFGKQQLKTLTQLMAFAKMMEDKEKNKKEEQEEQ